MTTKRKPARKRAPSTALARRPAASLETFKRRLLALNIHDPANRLPVLDVPAVNTLGDEATLGALGLVEVKLTEAEEKILAEPVLETEVRMKPTGQPYLSHPSYTRWFNRAFGRLGWAIVPRSKPLMQSNSVVCPYLLYIHGQPAAFAMGEQEYHANNREQTYGDALEATVASALRRCAKRLGVGLELWDRDWLDGYIARECVLVTIQKDGEFKKQWRRTRDRPFWNEVGHTTKGAPVTDTQRREAPAAPDPNGELPITDTPRKKPGDKVGQVQRLWIIVKKSQRTNDEIKAWLAVAYGLDSTKKIKRKDYEAICTAIERPGPLPKPAALEGEATVDRDPGQEG